MNSAYSSQPDPAMLELFQAEMDSHVPVLSDGLMALEKGQAGPREIEGMMRAAHSIKGAARIVGIEPAVRVAHTLEDCFTAAKNGKITLTSDSVDVLLDGVDALQRICSGGSEPSLQGDALQKLIDGIAAVRDGSASAAPTRAAPATTGSTQLVAATVRTQQPGITLPPVLDQASTEMLRKEMLDTLSLKPARIPLDFTQTDHLSADALSLIVAFAEEIARRQSTTRIEALGVSPAVRSVLDIAGLSTSLGLDL
jgi:two-component system sensor histidine kinase and response regulator WspE